MASSGTSCDFMMDAQSWAIRQLVIKTGHRFSGKEVQIPTRTVDRISYRGLHGVRQLDHSSRPAESGTPHGSCRCGRIDLARPIHPL